MMLPARSHYLLVTLQLLIHRTTQETPETPIQCPDVPKLNILPGIGLDALTNKDTKQIFKITYNKCKLTEDLNFQVPDDFEIRKINDTEVTGTITKHWLNYTSPTTTFCEQMHPNYLSFSDDYQEMKYLQIKYDAFMCRSQLRKTVYSVCLSSPLIDVYLKTKFVDILRAVNKNQFDRAKYLVQMVVREYGTHYTTTVDVGKVFIKEDYLRNDFKRDAIEIITESKLSLLETARFSWGGEHGLNSTLLSEYNDAVVEKKLRFLGGESLESVEKSVYFLSNLMTATNFPNASRETVGKVRQLLDEEIENYFNRNAHLGCTRAKSPNFVYIANVDDGSCKPTSNANYVFGGVFQACIQPTTSNNQSSCSGKTINNSLSGDTSCPTGFQTLLIKTEQILSKNVQLHTFYCISNSSSTGPSFTFGGLYSPNVNNAFTKAKSCPQFFKPLFIFDGKLGICVNFTDKQLLDHQNSSFGGFASCLTEFQCPFGYKKHLAIELQDEKIYYCLSDQEIENFGVVPLIKRPPFINLVDFDISIDDKNEDYDYGVTQDIESHAKIVYYKNVQLLIAFVYILNTVL